MDVRLQRSLHKTETYADIERVTHTGGTLILHGNDGKVVAMAQGEWLIAHYTDY